MQSTSSSDQTETSVSPDDADQGMRPPIEELKGRLEILNARVKGFIRERPAACLAGALALGYLVARIVRRRS